jgi:hypothetical protein
VLDGVQNKNRWIVAPGTVRLLSKTSGRPTRGKKVALGMEHTIGADVTHGERTDSDGEAHFDVKPGHGKIYVGGSKRHEGHLFGGVIVLCVNIAAQAAHLSHYPKASGSIQYEVSTRNDNSK